MGKGVSVQKQTVRPHSRLFIVNRVLPLTARLAGGGDARYHPRVQWLVRVRPQRRVRSGGGEGMRGKEAGSGTACLT